MRSTDPARAITAAGLACLLVACAPAVPPEPRAEAEPALEWSLALHGGAGTIPRDIDAAERQAYVAALEQALELGRSMLADGAGSLDTVEAVIAVLEDDPLFNAGKGAVLNHEGRHELDASIMNGSDLSCGAVAGVTTVKNPIRLARLVMERTRHVLLAGPGAERFADEVGVERVDNRYFLTPRRQEAWRKAQQDHRGTVGVVALDRQGHLAAGTSTGGLTGKRFGRIGDSPIVGAGTYADDGSCAVSATGIGEEFIRHGVARSVAWLVQQGTPVDEAARRMIHDVLRPGDGGVIALDRHGRVAMVFSTPGMYRGSADSSGRFEIGLWDEPEPR